MRGIFTSSIFARFLWLPAVAFAAGGCGAVSPADVNMPQEPVPAVDAYKMYVSGALPDSLLGELETIALAAERSNDLTTLVLANEILVNMHARRGDYREGFRAADNMLHYASVSGDAHAIARAYYATGKLYVRLGMPWKALEYFLKTSVMELSPEIKCNMLCAVGEAARMCGGGAKGIDPDLYYRLALRTALKQGDSMCVAGCLFGRSQLLFDGLNAYEYDQPLPQSLRDSARRSIAMLSEALEFDPGSCMACYAMGLSYAAMGDFPTAAYHVEKGSQVCRLAGDMYPVDMNARAAMNVCMGQYAEAARLCGMAYGAAEKQGMEGEMRRAVNILYHASKRGGDMAAALAAHERYSALMRAMDDRAHELDLLHAQVAYDTRVKEDELLEATRRNDDYRKDMLAMLFALAGVVAVLLCVIHRHLRSKRVRAPADGLRGGNRKVIPVNGTDALPAGPPVADAPTASQVALIERLRRQVEQDALFIRPDLTLGLMAHMLGTNRTYLSEAVNKVCGKNFNFYINEYRIREAVRIVSDPGYDSMTLDTVASEVGFNNRNSFYLSFRKITGVSPAEFRRNRHNICRYTDA